MVLGRPLDILLPERFREVHREHIRRFGYSSETGRTMGGIVPLHALRANGHEFAIEASISKVEIGDTLLFTVIIREITERHEAAKALDDSQALLAGIVGSAMDAIITIDDSQRITLFNAAAERIFGYRAGVVLGQPLDMLLPDGYRELHREHVERFGRTGVTSRSMRGLGTLFARRANGEEFPIEASISQTLVTGRKAYTVILRDVTEKRRSDEQLNQSLSLMRATLESIPGGIVVLDATGRIMLHNKRFEEQWNLPAELFLQNEPHSLWTHLTILLHDSEPITQMLQHFSEEGQTHHTLHLLDGRVMEHYSRPHILDGTKIGRVSTFFETACAVPKE
jgi:PAS domain S-box-containing protein